MKLFNTCEQIVLHRAGLADFFATVSPASSHSSMKGSFAAAAVPTCCDGAKRANKQEPLRQPRPQPGLHEHACLIGSRREHRPPRLSRSLVRSFRKGPCPCFTKAEKVLRERTSSLGLDQKPCKARPSFSLPPFLWKFNKGEGLPALAC